MDAFPLPPGLSCAPATPADGPRLAAFLSAAHPDRPVTAAELERRARDHLPADVSEVTLITENGELLGVVEVSTPRMDAHPGWLRLDITVGDITRGDSTLRPGLERGPLPGALLAFAEGRARALGAHTFTTSVREHWWERAFLAGHGYTEHDRRWQSVLDLRQLDFGSFQAEETKALASGVRIRPLSELGEFGEARQRQLYALTSALLRDVPSTTPISVWDFPVWQHRLLPHLRPEGLFLAVTPSGEWVGLSELFQPVEARPGTLHNGLTGVLAGWRGHSIGLALKLAAARAALGRGHTHSRTTNHSVNRPMLAINERLGFVKEGATVTMLKACGP